MKMSNHQRKGIKEFIQICHEEKLGRGLLIVEVQKLLVTNSGRLAGDAIDSVLQEPDMHKYISLKEY